MPTLTTFNANNFFLRYKFSRTYPGDMSKHSLDEAAKVTQGFLPGIAFGRYTKNFIVWDTKRRELAARALKAPDGQLPDIICFQEVENIQAIRVFNQRYLCEYYPYSLLIDAYDPRNIDVGLLSKFPIEEIRSHIDDKDNNGDPIFSRDCLEAKIKLPDGEYLNLFINHFKSKLVKREKQDTDDDYKQKIERSHKRRLAQVQKVAEFVEARFQGAHDTALYAVIGDFNDTPYSPWVNPLVTSNHLTDILAEHIPVSDRWTYYWRSRNRVSQIDYFLASPALAQRIKYVVEADANKKPHIERRGLAYRKLNKHKKILPAKAWLMHFEDDVATPPIPGAPPKEKIDFRFERYPEIMANWRENISDHCPVKVWF